MVKTEGSTLHRVQLTISLFSKCDMIQLFKTRVITIFKVKSGVVRAV